MTRQTQREVTQRKREDFFGRRIGTGGKRIGEDEAKQTEQDRDGVNDKRLNQPEPRKATNVFEKIESLKQFLIAE